MRVTGDRWAVLWASPGNIGNPGRNTRFGPMSTEATNSAPGRVGQDRGTAGTGEPAEVTPPRHRWVLLVVLAAAAAPLVAAAVAVARQGWTPVGEFAQAELRVRDFWAHPPTLGAVGRLRTPTDVSSHPGPIAWWAMYPVYAAFGRTAVALSVAVAATSWAWAAAALTLAWRRGGDALAVVLGLGVVALMAVLGPIAFVEPWNPWFAVMPLLAMVIATWAVLDRCPWALVMVVAAGSYCVQAHFGYLPVVGVLGVVALAGLWWNSRGEKDPSASLVPLGTSLGVGALLWLLPVAQQLTGDPGNVSVMIDAYRQEAGREPELGIRGALRLVGSYASVLSPLRTADGVSPTDRSIDVGTVVTLLAWVAAAWSVWRRRSERPMSSAGRLLAVVTVALAGAVVAAAQIPGEVFGYLILWLGVLVAALFVAILWIGWLAVQPRPEPPGTDDPAPTAALARYALRWGAPLSMALLVAISVGATVKFAGTEVPASHLSAVAEQLVGPVADELADRGDPEDSYLVRWDDPLAFGALGTGLLSELERNGLEVGVDDFLRVEMRPHRVLEEDRASAALWVVTGEGIDRWRALADSEDSEVSELVYVEPRSDDEIERSEQLRAELKADLAEVGGEALSEQLDRNYWVARSDPAVDQELRDRIDQLVSMGLPTAVFLAPADLAQP